MIHVTLSLYAVFVISIMFAPLQVSLHHGESEAAVFTGEKSILVSQIMDTPHYMVERAFPSVLGVDEYPHIFLGQQSIEYKSEDDIWRPLPEEGNVDLRFEVHKYPVRGVRGYRKEGTEIAVLEIDFGPIRITVAHEQKLDHSYRLKVLDYIGVPVRMINMSFENNFGKAARYSLWHEPIYMNSEAAKTMMCKPEEIVRALQIMECTYNDPKSDHDTSSDEENAAELVRAGVHIPAMKLFFASRGCKSYHEDIDGWMKACAQKFIHDITAEFGAEEVATRVTALQSLLGREYAQFFNT